MMLFLLGLINFYIAARLIVRWPWGTLHPAGIWFLTALFFLLQLVAPFGDRIFLPQLRRKGAGRLAYILDWASYFALGVMSILVMYDFVIDIAGLLLMPLQLNTSSLDFYAFLVLACALVMTLAIGLWHAGATPQVKSIDLTLPHLPATFDGFKIVQLSDLHVGPLIGGDYTQRVVDIANTLAPDLYALTGDFVDGMPEDLAEGVAPLSQLKAPHGAFFVTGNHEYYWDASAWIDVCRRLGMKVLLNEHEIIRRGEDALVLGGVTDYSAGHMLPGHHSSPANAFTGAPKGLVKILLAHQPSSYKAAAAEGVDLQLSGHTHSGQYFPFTFLIRFFHVFYKGLNKYGNMWLYINRGTGYWGPPLRTNAAEITLIILRRG